MPVIKSAKKRVKTAKKAAIRNSKTKRSIKTAVKAFQKALTGGKKTVEKELSKAHSALDKAGKKKVTHKNKVARQKSRLAKAAKAASGASKTAAAKKAAPKRTTSKNTTSKKSTTKK